MTSTVTCAFNPSWQMNSVGQNPCQVYAQLQGLCDSGFVIAGVTSASPPYAPPNNACGCNFVAYNLMGACSWCQSGIGGNWWMSKREWSGHCTEYHDDAVPDSVALNTITLPPWALAHQTWDSWSPAEAAFFSTTSAGTASSTRATVTSGGGTTPPSNEHTSAARASNPPATTTATTTRAADHFATNSVNIIFVVLSVIVAVFLGITVLRIVVKRQVLRKAWYSATAQAYLAQQRDSSGQNDPITTTALHPPSPYPGTPRSTAPLMYADQSPHWQTEHVYPPAHTATESAYWQSGEAYPQAYTTTENWYPSAVADQNARQPAGYEEDSEPPPFDPQYHVMSGDAGMEKAGWNGRGIGDGKSVYESTTGVSLDNASTNGSQTPLAAAGPRRDVKTSPSNTGALRTENVGTSRSQTASSAAGVRGDLKASPSPSPSPGARDLKASYRQYTEGP